METKTSEVLDLFVYLYGLNVNERVEKKKTGGTELSYLSWAWAWAEFMKACPDATYQIKMFDGKPYIYDENLGYMVFTSITAKGLTRDCWLPVMDGANKAMKAEPYSYTTRSGERYVEGATMFDINKTIMRCLVKNMSFFGLGLYIYAGEDLPDTLDDIQDPAMIEALKKREELQKLLQDKERNAKTWESVKDNPKLKEIMEASGITIEPETTFRDTILNFTDFQYANFKKAYKTIIKKEN